MTIAIDWPTQLQAIWSDDLSDYVAAIATMWAEVEVYQADPANDVVSWQALLDVDIAPLQALPWLTQLVGDRLPVGLDEAAARDWIKATPNWQRGTPAGIVAAVQRLLIDPAVVQFGVRRHLDGTVDVDAIAILTYASETPDPQAVRNALRRTVPADIVWEYNVVIRSTWSIVQAGAPTWAQLQATSGPTWNDVTASVPGYDVW
jgi:hypothetical protein